MDESIGIYSYRPIPIGKGSFSLVFRGKNTLTDDIIAVKRINILNKDEEFSRIESEIDIMKSLEHSNIVKLYDVLYDNCNNINLIMEYCDLGDLSLFLNSKPLKEKYAKRFMIQIKNAVEYLYKRNIFHRDIKPQNILLTKNKIIKLSDFGFAKRFNSKDDKMSSTICGSPIYMAPEIIKQNNYNTKVDLWSIGIILYEMITGIVPFKARNYIELIHKINTSPIYLPMTILISTECRDMINGLLQKNPHIRMDWDHFFNHPWLMIDNSNLLDFVEEYDYHPKSNKNMEIRVPSSPRDSMIPIRSKPINIKVKDKEKENSYQEEFEDSFISPMFNTPIMITPNSNNGYIVVKIDGNENSEEEFERSFTDSLVYYMNKTIKYFRS